MYNLHKIILLYINEMFKLKNTNRIPKDWPWIPLIIHNKTDVLLWIHDTRCEAKLISAQFPMLGDDLSVWDFLSSMTFDDFSKFHDFPWLFQKKNIFPGFPGFPDPVGNLFYCRYPHSTMTAEIEENWSNINFKTLYCCCGQLQDRYCANHIFDGIPWWLYW